MKKTILSKHCAVLLLAGLALHAMPASDAFADLPGVSREARQRLFEQRMQAEKERRLSREMSNPRADVWIRSGDVGTVELVFGLAGPGECEYTLRGPLSAGGAGPVVARGREALPPGPGDKRFRTVDVAIPPALEENEEGDYGLEAVCRLKVVENTNFGPKTTNREEEARISRKYRLLRQSVYQVNP